MKAMGVLLKDRNQAQVSMNLTDYEQTPVELVFETVGREAEQYGVSIAGSEIIGLIPQKAIEQAVEFYLRVENFSPEVILENRLAEVMAQVQPSSMADMLRFCRSCGFPGADARRRQCGSSGRCARGRTWSNGDPNHKREKEFPAVCRTLRGGSRSSFRTQLGPPRISRRRLRSLETRDGCL